MLRQMILDHRKARSFAGKTTAAMIALGASPEVMRRNDIPRSTFYGVFGGRKWERTTPEAHAAEMIDTYKASVIFEHNGRR